MIQQPILLRVYSMFLNLALKEPIVKTLTRHTDSEANSKGLLTKNEYLSQFICNWLQNKVRLWDLILEALKYSLKEMQSSLWSTLWTPSTVYVRTWLYTGTKVRELIIAAVHHLFGRSFNSIWSNILFILFGLLFIFIVWGRWVSEWVMTLEYVTPHVL